MFEDLIEKFNIDKHFEIASGEMKFLLDKSNIKSAISLSKISS